MSVVEPSVPVSARAKGLKGALESKKLRRQSFADYRRFIRDHYDGLAGKLTVNTNPLDLMVRSDNKWHLEHVEVSDT